MSEARLKPTDRLGIALFLAALFHLVVILGLRFRLPRGAPSHALDVTLVQARSTAKPRHASRLAQVNVQGGGGSHKRHMAHTPFAATRNGGANEQRKAERHQTAAKRKHLRLLHTLRSALQVTLTKPTRRLHAALARELGLTQQFAAEEARLKAEIRRDWRVAQARGTGRGGVNARSFAYATYIARWNHHMEHLGSRQYPRLLAGRALTGSLVLAVSIRADGSLASVKVIRGSRHPMLNAAAIAMVRHAAPFAPLPAVGKTPLSVLPIIETWHFRGGRMARAQPSISTAP